MPRKKWNNKNVKEYIESFNYKLLDEYKNTRIKLKMVCNKGHEFYMDFNHFYYRGQRCPYCYGNIKSSQQEVKEYFEKFNYKLLSEYEGNNKPLRIECPKGHVTNTMTYARFKDGCRCCKCANNNILTYDYIKSEMNKEGYKLLATEYINAHQHLMVECPNGHKYEVTWNNFHQGNRCPICNESKGERKIMNWLIKNNVKYIYNEPYFKDLLSEKGNPLRPDFIIEDKKIWIEFDGDFHFRKVYKNDRHELIQFHDKLKNEYAINNNWKLIRIPYWEFDRIEEILELELKQ